MNALKIVTPFMLVALLLVQAGSFIENTSATYDEPLYARLGSEVVYGKTFLGFIRPMIPPLPVLIAHAPAAGVLGESSELRQRVTLARWIHAVILGTSLIAIVYVWLLRRRGWLPAAFGTAMMALSSNVVAYCAIATTDLCGAIFSLLAVAALAQYAESTSRKAFFLFAVAMGLALAAKQSAVFLAPAFLGVEFIRQVTRANAISIQRVLRSGIIASCKTILVLIIAFTVNWSLYGFAAAPILAPGVDHASVDKLLGTGPRADRLRTLLETVPVPASVNTFLGQIAHNSRGHSAYFRGEVSRHGWTFYYPVAVLVKATPAELLLVALGLVLAIVNWHQGDSTSRVWLVCIVIYLFMCLTSKLALGVRYLAPAYPLVILICVDAVARMRKHNIIYSMMIAMQAIAAFSAWPYGYLSYFNSFAGGPSQGHRHLADSNLDWGQDLPALKRILDGEQNRRVAIAYFGDLLPAEYGIESVPWNAADADFCGSVAISVSFLCGIDYGRERFAAFRELVPDAKAGESIWIYRLSRTDVRAALRQARNSN